MNQDLFATATPATTPARPRLVVREPAAPATVLTPPARETAPAAAPTAPAAPSLDAILGTRAKKGGEKKATGIIVTDPELLKVAAEFIQAKTAEDEAKGRVEALKMTFAPACRRAWFAANAGRTSPESSLKFVTDKGRLSASFAAQWFPKNDQVVAATVPAAFRTRKCKITIDVSKIPDAVQGEVVAALVAVMAQFNVEEALEAKLVDYPTEAFGSARHTILTPEQNEAAEQAGLDTRVSFRC